MIQGGFSEYFSIGEPSLNNKGQVAFVVEPAFGNSILVTGPDLVGIAFSREGYNDAGQLAFIAFFTDGTSAPHGATPSN